LDQVFGLPLREGLIHPDELEAEAGLLLQALLEIGQATNMPLERLLAQIKKASPSISRRATVQRVLSAGMLTQLMNHHLQRGGIDSRLGHRQSAPSSISGPAHYDTHTSSCSRVYPVYGGFSRTVSS
jgi:hypothetical protein